MHMLFLSLGCHGRSDTLPQGLISIWFGLQ